MATYKKKLIEVALPLEAINEEAARRKQKAPKGYPTAMHKWWAQIPVAAARAILFAQLVDDPSSDPDRYPSTEDQEARRQYLFDLLARVSKWENNADGKLFDEVLDVIRDSCGGKLPSICDPFSGGGTIALESQRLGLPALASDLNPVPVLIGKALFELPYLFRGRSPVNPDGRGQLGLAWSRASGLAADVRHYGNRLRELAWEKLFELYPKADLPPELGGGKATVVAWMWARTVPSPNPAFNGAPVPLVRSFLLSEKKGAKVWLEPQIDKANGTYSFVIRRGAGTPPKGTVSKKDGSRCLLSNDPMKFEYMREQGLKGKMGTRLLAAVVDTPSGRTYVIPGKDHEVAAASASADWRPEQDLPENTRDFKTPLYGFMTYGDLFTERQLQMLNTFCDLVEDVRGEVLKDALEAGQPEGEHLKDGGTGAKAYADAVALYLGFAISRLVHFNSSQCRWLTKDQAVAMALGQQALPMVWDFVEGNPFGKSSSEFGQCLKNVIDCIETAPAGAPATIVQADARRALEGKEAVVISTDPPYYDNVGYADLSDFFYVWLRRCLGKVFPNLFGTMLTPKTEELVALPYRHEDVQAADRYFLEGMRRAISTMAEASAPEFPVTIYYAFKQSETNDEGVSSTGWAVFLDAVISAGFSIVGTWPIRTQNAGRLIAMDANALASAVVLVCRKRPAGSPFATRSEFLKELKNELSSSIRLLQEENIAPVDMAQAAIGPGMAIFSRHAAVLESDDTSMTVKTALQLINQALDEFLSEQEGEYDAETRFAITWFETNGMEAGLYGTAEVLATAKGISVSGVAEAGVLEAKGGQVRLLRREEMPEDWDPRTDKRLTVWECVQHLIRVVDADGDEAGARLLKLMGSKADPVRDLAYRLYGICERKKWSEEAIAYNNLVVVWPDLVKMAANAVDEGPAQGFLI